MAGNGIQVRGLGHVTLFVRDVEASARFYRDVLGLLDQGRAKYHIAFRIGTTREALEAARTVLTARGLPVFGEWISGSSHSISTRAE